MFDHLGREVPAAKQGESLALSEAPVFAVFPPEVAARFDLDPPPEPAPWLEGKPCPVVLQAVQPENRTVCDKSAYRVSKGKEERLPVYVYNFSGEAVEGRLSVRGPEGWSVAIAEPVSVAVDGRAEVSLTVTPPQAESGNIQTIEVAGDFGAAGRAVLSVRLLVE